MSCSNRSLDDLSEDHLIINARLFFTTHLNPKLGQNVKCRIDTFNETCVSATFTAAVLSWNKEGQPKL